MTRKIDIFAILYGELCRSVWTEIPDLTVYYIENE